MSHADSTAHEPSVLIFIDGHEYKVHGHRVTAADLRQLARPPIARDRQLWLDIPDAPDQLLADGENIELRPDMRFFSEPHPVTLYIDRTAYTVTRKRMTGDEMRHLPTPPLAADRDLWLDRIDEQDKKIADDDVVRLHDAMRFFTAPGRINPGAR
ncbi:multiubiquitin domain-containing protein [Streptomyces sp. NPDC004680]|uniref:multiubiquitin domain-containing protein n=1 Tax=Streptomyces sp. NPDC004680 TaxID=3154287 RepID=UPI00339DC569